MHRNMKRHILAVLLIVLAGFGSGCDSKSFNSITHSIDSTQPAPRPITPFEPGIDPASKTIRLILPQTQGAEYYNELVETALINAGYRVDIRLTPNEPQTRVIADLDNGSVSLYYMLQSAERDAKYPSIKVNLTNGLIGSRILFIRKGTQSRFDGLLSPKDFRDRHLIGAIGANWFDGKVWKANNLLYVGITGDWKLIYGMLKAGDRGIDYFPRGANEIWDEYAAHPELDIEKNLILKYDRDFHVYLGKNSPALKPVLESALQKAQADGTINRLVQKHYAKQLNLIQYDNRKVINLNTPE
ncbi:MAG: hypothetical protein ACM3QZ_04780 [Solirubrobacterales bacterium]